MPPPSDKLCMVCGDKALGYNFNAVTCESCKAFFRRNALSNKEFVCPFSENCDITVVTRRFCQKCRLEKCFTIGMRKDYIMSEEDKVLKKIKIEQNRTKRRSNNVNEILIPNKIKKEVALLMEEGSENKKKIYNTYNPNGVDDDDDNDNDDDDDDDGEGNGNGGEYNRPRCGKHSNSSGSSKSNNNNNESDMFPVISSSTEAIDRTKQMPSLDSSSADIVDRLVNYPEDASKLINHLMKTPTDAVTVMTKILNSQKDAMRLIGHLIGSPGDALKIISKIMNSPFDALTVFTKFMSSPTDALEIIAKIASSPGEVLQFIQQLMNSPEDALQIMNKFMNSPAEALKMLNKMVNNPGVDSTTTTTATVATTTTPPPPETINKDTNQLTSHLESELSKIQGENLMIKSMLGIKQSTPLTTIQQTNDIGIKSIVNNMESISCDKANKLNGSFENSTSTIRNILQDTMDEAIFPNSLESVICEAINLEYEPQFNVNGGENSDSTNSIGGSSNNITNSNINNNPNDISGGYVGGNAASNSRDLNEAERAKLNELIVANKALYAPLEEDLSGLDECANTTTANQNSQDPQLLKIVNLTAIAIRRLIKMSKKINAFRNMCQEDQVALLKGGCTEMMILRSAMQYDIDHATWKVNTRVPNTKEAMSSITVDVLKLAKGNVYEAHETFIRTFDPKWRHDENIILILSAIVLFTPTRPKIVHSDVLKFEQNSYYYLLRRYLESIYPGCEAKSTFLKLIQKILDLQRLNNEIVGVYLDVNPSQVEPLLKEIFDIKNH